MVDRGIRLTDIDERMTYHAVNEASAEPLTGRIVALWRRMPWWVRVVLIFALARLVTTVMMLQLAAAQPANAWTGASPGYFDFASMWDGRWYQIAAFWGYPSELPLTEDGHIGENAWAFMPVYPIIVRLVMTVTFASWPVAAVLVSLVFGFASAVMFYRLMRCFLKPSTAMFSVVVFSFAPLSPMMQVAYAESTHVFLLTLALYLVVRRRYVWLLPVIGVMSLTRPSGLAFALFLGLHVLQRLWVRRRDPFPARQLIAASGAAAFSGLMGFAWPLAAWAVTGSVTAYTDTELAWRSAYIGYHSLVPFAAWIQAANWWSEFVLHVPMGALVLIPLIALFAVVMLSRPVKRLGIDLRLWVVSYVIYLLAVFFPQSSTFRLFMPVFPLAGALAQPASRLYRVSLVIVSIALQYGWLLICWRVDGYDWSPP